MDKVLSELTIEIIQKCANKCLFCSSLSGRSAKHLIEFEDVFDIGKQAKKLGLKEISISGGEPLLHPDVLKIVTSLLSLDLNVSIYTTGVVLDPHGQAQAFTEWGHFDTSALRLIFGVQSSNANVHDSITQHQGSFDLTKKSMLSAKKEGFAVEVHVVPNRINLSTLESTVSDFLSWGIDRISFLRLVAQGYARKYKEQLLLDENETETLKKIFLKLSERYQENNQLRLGIPFSGIIEQPKACNAGETKLIIRYDGKVLPCEAFKDEGFNEYILGDIKNDKLDILLSKSTSNISLRSLKNLITPIETCPAQFLYSNLI